MPTTSATRPYQAVYILNLKGREEGASDAIAALEKEIRAAGGKVLGAQKLGARQFERTAGKVDGGYYVCLDIELAAEKVSALTEKLKLNPLVHRQQYISGSAKPLVEAPARSGASAAA